MFEVIGVIDLRDGAAVRARGGRREQYQPIDAVAGEAVRRGDPTDVARQYADGFGLERLYVADLDAIEGRRPHTALVRDIAASVPVWLDAGITSVDAAHRALDAGVERVIVGLETLPSFDVLASISRHAGPESVVFSLDVRNGTPVTVVEEFARQQPEGLVARATDAGVAAIIVLDLARVGTECGFDLPLLSRLRAASRTVPLYAGGGVRSMDDLRQARSAGCDGALVASALLDGQITEQDLRQIQTSNRR